MKHVNFQKKPHGETISSYCCLEIRDLISDALNLILIANKNLLLKDKDIIAKMILVWCL